MNPRLPVLAASLAVVLALPLGIGASAEAKPKPKKSDLVVQSASQTSSAAGVAVTATIKNKGRKKAKASVVRFTLSADSAPSAEDKVLGTLPVSKLKKKKKSTVSGTFAVPTGTAAGSYVVIACADAAGQVKERKEQNNCDPATGSTVVVSPTTTTPPPATTTTVRFAVDAPALSLPTAPTVTATTTAGSCTANPAATGTCTVPTGAATVTLTVPNNGINYAFQNWTAINGAPCDGVATSTGTTQTMTLTNPTAAKGCTANFAGAA